MHIDFLRSRHTGRIRSFVMSAQYIKEGPRTFGHRSSFIARAVAGVGGMLLPINESGLGTSA